MEDVGVDEQELIDDNGTITVVTSLEELGLVEVTHAELSLPSFENVISSHKHQQQGSNDGATELHFAVATGNEDVVEEILKHHQQTKSDGDVDSTAVTRETFIESATTEDNRTVLHIAASSNKESIVKLLLRYGADVNAKAKYGLTPLHFAATKGHATMCSLLIEEGADVWFTLVPPKKEHTALHLAAINGRFDAFVVLFERMASCSLPSDTSSGLLLKKKKNKKLMVWKRKKNRDQMERNESHSVVDEEHKEKGMKEKGMKEGKLVDIRTASEGTTLLHCAVVGCEAARDEGQEQQQQREGVKIIHFLLQHGADSLASSTNGWTPLHLAAALGSMEACVALLQGLGEDANGSKLRGKLLKRKTKSDKKKTKQRRLRASDIARLRSHLEVASFLDDQLTKVKSHKPQKRNNKRSDTMALLEEDPD
eukprot:TRINITY_DN5411_c0_g1_i1.p1 TRINITY_DN5411_c0_g1~~TRINITY_DN5411_c0_g1_i1.p1  ORF type:complete len:425 (-),score=120.52 TRINITY_DN5411_c0_g1_i1:169-1443(-)